MKKYKLILLSVLIMCMPACGYRKYDEIKPKSPNNNSSNNNNTISAPSIPCDSAAALISYSKHIAPIMEAQCGSKNSCHSIASAKTTELEDYNGVSYSAATGQLISCIVWDGSTIAMPQNTSTKLDACYIAEIQKWVNAGFPNN